MGKLPVGGGSVREEWRRPFVVSSSELDASTCSEINISDDQYFWCQAQHYD